MSATTSRNHFEPQQFYDAIFHYIDEAKPDPLAKNQMINLRLDWKEHIPEAANDDGAACAPQEGAEIKQFIDNISESCGIFGTLTLSSEYINHHSCPMPMEDTA